MVGLYKATDFFGKSDQNVSNEHAMVPEPKSLATVQLPSDTPVNDALTSRVLSDAELKAFEVFAADAIAIWARTLAPRQPIST